MLNMFRRMSAMRRRSGVGRLRLSRPVVPEKHADSAQLWATPTVGTLVVATTSVVLVGSYYVLHLELVNLKSEVMSVLKSEVKSVKSDLKSEFAVFETGLFAKLDKQLKEQTLARLLDFVFVGCCRSLLFLSVVWLLSIVVVVDCCCCCCCCCCLGS